MTDKELERLDRKIRRAIERLIGAGGFMNSGWIYNVGKDGRMIRPDLGCCLLGAVLHGHEWSKFMDTHKQMAARLLGISYNEAKELERGYVFSVSTNNPLQQLGHRYRVEFYGGTPDINLDEPRVVEPGHAALARLAAVGGEENGNG